MEGEKESSAEKKSKKGSDQLIGKVFAGKYKIESKLGAGGMGGVYKANHELMGRTVAIKLLHTHLAENEDYLSRFTREARIASKLNHPNAITLFDFGIDDETPFLVMEYVEGISLKDALLTEGAFELDRTNRILQQSGSALRQAHKLGIVHRDLKPDNIMLSKTDDGEEIAQVLDFGIAKMTGYAGSEDSAQLTQTGVFMGTPLYMAPEQAMQKDIDGRADIYALGIILYEMLSGQVPFKSDSPMEVVMQHVSAEPPSMTRINPTINLPKPVSSAVFKALAKEPENRFQTVDELIDEFDRGATTAPKTRKTIKVSADKIDSWKIAAPAAAFVIILLIAFFSLGSSEQEPVEKTPLASKQEVVVASTQALVEETKSLDEDAAGKEKPDAASNKTKKTAIVVDRSKAEKLYANGKGYLEKKDYARAGMSFKKALDHYPDYLMARLSLGLCFLRLNKPAFAKKQFDKALKLDPLYAPSHYNMATYYAAVKNPEKSVEELKRAISLFPDCKEWAKTDPDFDLVRDSEIFKQALE